MRLRVAPPYKPKRSGMWWFRIVVPERHRAAVGKREIKETLGTTDIAVARAKRAAKLAEIGAMFAGLEQQQMAGVDDRADKIVAMGFDALARGNARFHADMDGFDVGRGLDNVYYFILRMLGFRARLDWGGGYASHARWEELDEIETNPLPLAEPDPASAFPTFAHRDALTENIAVLENKADYKGAAFRESRAPTSPSVTGGGWSSRWRSSHRRRVRPRGQPAPCSTPSPSGPCVVSSITASATGPSVPIA